MSNVNGNNSNVSAEVLVHEVPSSLKQLARLVVRGFYCIEDALIVDMLVRNPCMKEEDICDLLKFEKKMLRSRITVLKNDKFIQTRLRMETGIDGKVQRVNYYYINYKTFVNVVKYKLDMMRKRMETEERDATSRASFKCNNCMTTFTDLQADQLFDFASGEFRCTFCMEVVEEDASALPKKDSRLMLAKFNEQMETLFLLLREVEGIKLAPEILEPDPVDISKLKGTDGKKDNQSAVNSGTWSGEATRRQNLFGDTQMQVTISDGSVPDATQLPRREVPIWMTESTVLANTETSEITQTSSSKKDNTASTSGFKPDDIMSVLLAHEKPDSSPKRADYLSSNKSAIRSIQEPNSDSDSDTNEPSSSQKRLDENLADVELIDDQNMGDDNDDKNDDIPLITVGSRQIPITELTDVIINEMTPDEKLTYIRIYQEYFADFYD